MKPATMVTALRPSLPAGTSKTMSKRDPIKTPQRKARNLKIISY